MINQRIAYRDGDGISIVSPTPEFCANPANTIGTLIRTLPLGVHFEVHCVEDIPTDRYFRNAWRLDKGVNIDVECAKKIHLDCLRKVRNKKLTELDVPFQRALEDKDTVMQDNIAEKKNALRDMPQNVDMSLLDSPGKIKAFLPDVLA